MLSPDIIVFCDDPESQVTQNPGEGSGTAPGMDPQGGDNARADASGNTWCHWLSCRTILLLIRKK